MARGNHRPTLRSASVVLISICARDPNAGALSQLHTPFGARMSETLFLPLGVTLHTVLPIGILG